MKNIITQLLIVLSISFTAFTAEVTWTKRLEGSSISGSTLVMQDAEFSDLNSGLFSDVTALSYIRLGLSEQQGMDYLSKDTRVRLNLTITPYSNAGVSQTPFTQLLEVIYTPTGNGITVDAEDYRMLGVHKFSVTVTSTTVEELTATGWQTISAIPSFLYLETGFSAERYYQMDVTTLPAMSSRFITYAVTGTETATLNTTAWSSTNSSTDEIELNWDYITGAEYYDLEWTWVDNYEQTPSTIAMSEGDFVRNSTRVRLSAQSYRLPQTFAKGYLIYRVRGVGRWMSSPKNDLYGQWSSGITAKITVQDWPTVITIIQEHENSKNWQYQATYAEDGKKKEVVQYFDGSLRGRETVTRINSNNQSVVGETIYDNEGRGVIQILPVPQDNPAIRFYPSLNENQAGVPYNYENFDVEPQNASCTVVPADPLGTSKGAGAYYSANGHTTDTDWQKNVPEANGYAFTQVEYTPDNTGRIRNQSGVGATHKIGSGHETYYYYVQPSQEELNRLFGYKVGYKSRYKKNMVVDANGQVSVSYLDAQGRVVATAIAGDNHTQFETLPSSPTEASLANTDLLNKLAVTDTDTEQDDNILYSTGNIGAEKDALKVGTQLPVVEDGTIYHFNYNATAGVYTEAGCEGQPGVNYPYVYDLTISIKDDCGNEKYSQTIYKLGIEQIGSATNQTITEAQQDIALNKGSYTVYKELKINQEALDHYLAHYLSADGNPCLQEESSFASEIEADCNHSCESCLADLGTEQEFILARTKEELGENTTLALLTTQQYETFQTLYQAAKTACVEPCTPLTNCDSYLTLMRMDISPTGQYGSMNGTDILSVYTPSNNLGANWQTATYLDENGDPAKVTVYTTDGGNTFNVAFSGSAQTDGDGNYWISPNQLTNVSDFAGAFQESWADALVQYHPEYKLYEYAVEICNTTYSVPTTPTSPQTTVDLSSEVFDMYLRDNVFTLSQAQGTTNELYLNEDFYGIDFVGTTGDAIYNIDPYFHTTYSSIHILNNIAGTTNDINNTVRKTALMEYALHTNYKNSGMTMLEYAIRSVVGGYNLSTPDISSYNTWTTFLSTTALTTDQKNLIFQNYKSYYLSYKAQINQLLMDMYGYYQTPGLFNGAIGEGGFTFGVLPDFSADLTYPTLINDFFEICGLTSPLSFGTYFPSLMTLPEYDSREIRITRVDALTYNTSPQTAQLEEIEQDADYAMWQSTGLCPLTIDMERFINQLGRNDQLTTDQAWNNVEMFTPDLFTAVTGIEMTNSQGNDIHLTGTISGTSLQLNAVNQTTTTTNCIATLPEITPTLPWSTFGTVWHIYQVAGSYPLSNTQIKLLITAGTTQATAEQYVITYTSCIDLNTCQANYSQNNALNADCNKRDQFEDAMLGLLQKLTANNALTSTSVALNSYAEYSTTILFDYFGAGATWNGTTATITNTTTTPTKSFQIGTSIPSNVVMVNGYNIVGTDVYAQYSTYSSLTAALPATTGVYSYTENNLSAPFNFNCSCEELNGLPPVSNEIRVGPYQQNTTFQVDHDLKLKAFFNEIIVATENGTPINPSSALPEDLIPYYGIDATYTVSKWMEIFKNPKLHCSVVVQSILPGDENHISRICHTTFNFIVDGEVILGNQSNADWSLISTLTTSPLGTMTIVLENTEESPVTITDDGCGFVITPPCIDCQPEAQSPVSCTDAYTTFTTYMNTLSITPTANYTETMTQEHFCNMTYAYITAAYLNYLDQMNVTMTTDLLYVTISEFGSTAAGYSNSKLTTAVNAFAAYKATNPTDNILWNDWFNTIYAVENGPLCPAVSPQVILPTLPDEIVPCDEWEENISTVNAQNQYGIYLNQVQEAFVHNYVSGAMSTVVENFTESHLEKEYHYTLYYYDRAGNLLQTVPPKGVQRMELDQAENTAVNTVRSANITAILEDNIVAPQHTLQTDYHYNSLNQLVYQNTPDGGESRFAYDKLGRLVVSQNAKQKQAQPAQFSYTLYDPLGRVTEVGEFTDNQGLTIDEMGHLVEIYIPTNLFDVNSTNWINLTSFAREEVTRTVYDKLQSISLPMPGNTAQTVRNLFGNTYSADNTRNRIVGVVYQSIYNADISTYDNATFYDYDVHGNVKEMIQINNQAELIALNQHFKKVNYEYDLVSGNVNKVIYQKDKQDQFIHRYQYDSDNRITIAETSKDNFTFEKDAKYFYYDHGPLARTEIGEKKVQAEDYAYTIQGWLKAVNGEQISENTMMGNDGASINSASLSQSTINSQVARDAFGYALSYFSGDYASADMSMLNFTSQNADLNIPTGGTANTTINLYNGNIRSMYTALSKLDEASLGTHQTVYRYDQLNRIKDMTGYNVATDGIVTGSNLSGYSSEYSYDANGNLLTMKNFAKNSVNTTTMMDDFSYAYNANNNQLNHVGDFALSNAFTEDVDNQNADNYGYDQIGQLIKDNAENISEIKWTVTNKVKEVIYGGALTGKHIVFDYDAMGHRIAKHSTTTANETTSTYYILDAQGNPMSTYEYKTFGSEQNKLYLSERNIYGSKRVGIEQVNKEMLLTETATGDMYIADWEIGDKRYELANHLGNVLNVITDRKLPMESTTVTGLVAYYTSDVVSYSDYMPFGQVMPNRHGDDNQYRYGFQGQERDDELKGDGNSLNYEFRMHDPRIGRFFARDPLADKYPFNSPYAFSENRVIDCIEIEGLEAVQVSFGGRATYLFVTVAVSASVVVAPDGIKFYFTPEVGVAAGINISSGFSFGYFNNVKSADDLGGFGVSVGASATVGGAGVSVDGQLSIQSDGSTIGGASGSYAKVGSMGAEAHASLGYSFSLTPTLSKKSAFKYLKEFSEEYGISTKPLKAALKQAIKVQHQMEKVEKKEEKREKKEQKKVDKPKVKKPKTFKTIKCPSF